VDHLTGLGEQGVLAGRLTAPSREDGKRVSHGRRGKGQDGRGARRRQAGWMRGISGEIAVVGGIVCASISLMVVEMPPFQPDNPTTRQPDKLHFLRYNLFEDKRLSSENHVG
jgi:hypothetical protein